jgi:glucose/arabinose dehydrogenase
MAPRKDAGAAPADTAAYRIETVASGLTRPWSVVFLPDGAAADRTR